MDFTLPSHGKFPAENKFGRTLSGSRILMTQAFVPTRPLPLLATKLYLPAPRATAVTRPRLVARLLRGISSRLTLIAAPAGFGKSTLLAQGLGVGSWEPGKESSNSQPP